MTTIQDILNKKKKKEELPQSNLQNPTQAAQPNTTQKIQQPSSSGGYKVITNQETGKPSGIQLPSGQVFLGLKKADIEGFISREEEKQGLNKRVEAVNQAFQPSAAELLSQKTPEIEQTLAQAGALNPELQKAEQLNVGKTKADVPVLTLSSTFSRQKLLAQGYSPKQLRKLYSPEFEDLGLIAQDQAVRDFMANEIPEGFKYYDDDIQTQLGIVLESIPGVANVARKYTGNLLKTPSKQADTLVSELKGIKESISKIGELSANDVQGAENSLMVLNSYESRANEIEARLQLLTIISPELIADPTELDKIETELNNVYLEIYNSRNKAARNFVTQRTGLEAEKSRSLLSQYQKV